MGWIKGTVSQDFLLLVFFMNQFPPRPRVLHLDHFKFFWKFAEIFASQCAPPVSTTLAEKLPPVSTTTVANLPPVSATPAANFNTIFASVVDTGGKLPPVSTTPAANLPLVSTTPVANCHRYQRHRWQIIAKISGCRHLNPILTHQGWIWLCLVWGPISLKL